MKRSPGRSMRRTGARTWLGIVSLVLATAAFTTGSLAQGAPAPLPEWMCGHWVMELGGRKVEETWLDALGGTLFAVGRTSRDGRLQEFEFLRIVSRGDSLVFIAQPNGAPPTDFRLTARTDRSVRFENRAHDFPQIVRYWSVGPDTLSAEVSGAMKGAEKAIQFGYRRKPFPAPATR